MFDKQTLNWGSADARGVMDIYGFVQRNVVYLVVCLCGGWLSLFEILCVCVTDHR